MMPASTKRHGKLLLLLFLIMRHTRVFFGCEYAKLRWRAFNCNYYTYSRKTRWTAEGRPKCINIPVSCRLLRICHCIARVRFIWLIHCATDGHNRAQQLLSSLQLVGRLLRQSNAQAHPLRTFSENHSMCMNINLRLNLA